MAVTLTDQLVGQLVGGRYQVVSRVARGGMATVYLAMDRLLERRVALKVMHPHLAEGVTGADFIERFRREAKAAARLAHPGLVAVFDQGTDGETSYLVMEYVEGTNLRRALLEDGPKPVREALQTVEAVLEALAVAHRAGVIHRDIKPENVLVASDGGIKVADFGLARAMAEASSTSTGTVLGSVAYLAPELVAFGASDERTDLYSVGILLYELITGQQPFVGTTPLQIAYQHVSTDVPAPSALLEWLPTEIDTLVATLSAREPSDRPASADAALELVRRTHRRLPAGLLSRRAGSVTRRALLGYGANSLEIPSSLDELGSPVLPATNGQAQPTNGHAGAATNGHLATSPQAHEDAPQRRRRWLLAVVPLVVAFAVAAGLGGWWYMTSGPGALTTVPEGLVGGTGAGAAALLADAGLDVFTVEVFHPTEPAGTVLGVHPSEGLDVAKDGRVTVMVSKGPDLRAVPSDLVGKPLEEAQAILAGAGFEVPPALMEYSDTVPAGIVLGVANVDGVAIEAGTSLPVGSVIILTCSDGVQPVTIPDVVGMTKDAAIAAIEALGLKASMTYAYSDDVAAGIVKAQSPAAGTEGHRLDTVSFVVSKGKAPPPPPPAGTVKVPDVVGKLKADARDRLEAAGFQVGWNFDQCTGDTYACRVVKQSPAAGTNQAKGTKVTLYLKNP